MWLRGSIITCDAQNRTLLPGYIRIEQGIIQEVIDLQGPPPWPIDEKFKKLPDTILFNDQWILPGFINGHSHSVTSLLRGRADQGATAAWLAILMRLEQELTEDQAYFGASAAILEMINHGITTFADMYFFPDAIARAAVDLGMRAIVGAHITDDPRYTLDLAQKFYHTWHEKHELITPAYAPHAPYSVSMPLIRDIVRTVQESDARVLMHIAEQKDEHAHLASRGCSSYGDWIHKSGVHNVRSILAHGAHLTDDDLDVIGQARASLIHCPTSNAKLSAGIAPVQAWLTRGIPAGLGTDGAASNNRLSIMREMHLASIMQGLNQPPRTQLEAATALAMATLAGARAIYMDHEIGSIEPGKRADIITIRKYTPHTCLFAPISTIVYAAQEYDVDNVMINGVWRKRDGTLCIDPDVLDHIVEMRTIIADGLG